MERLREDYLRPEWVASIGREYVEVKALKETEGEDIVLRRAKAFAAICREMPIEIFEDELIVSWFDYEPHGCALPVKSDPGLGDRLDVLTSRERNPVTISEEQKQIIREEIMPYWRGDGRHLLRWTSALYDNPPLPEIRELMYFDGFRTAKWDYQYLYAKVGACRPHHFQQSEGVREGILGDKEGRGEPSGASGSL